MRWLFSRWTAAALVAGCLLGLVAGLIYFVILPEQRKRVCHDHLVRLGQALHAYEEEHGVFPPAYVEGKDGKPAHSWRVLILPYLGRKDLYDAYHLDEPWDGPNNRKLRDLIGDVYACPADQGSPTWRTNYVAVVGSQTAWPGPHAIRVGEIIDGCSNTFQVIELPDSDICWMEPRDVVLTDVIPWNTSRTGPRWGSPHRDVINVLYCDGSVHPIKKTVPRYLIFSLLTANQGFPYRGELLPGEKPVAGHPFPEQVDADRLTGTTILPHLEGALTAGQNAVYCASFQLAWDEIRRKAGPAGLQLEGNPPLAAALNRGTFPATALAADSVVARAGSVKDGIVPQINKEMAAKFPGVPISLPVSEGAAAIAYAFIQKQLPFAHPFDALAEPLIFHARTADVPVRAFGFRDFSGKSDPDAWLSETDVLSYTSDEEFVIRLTPTRDEIILAMVPPAATLSETLSAVQERVKNKPVAQDMAAAKEKETLIVPNLALNVLRQYHELVPRALLDSPYAGLKLGDARQTIRFMLNETGAVLESEVMLNMFDGHETPPKPRRFVLDRPFLLFLKEKQAEQPYLVMWIENTEFMERMK